jgi:RNA polymerase sigma-70 factor (ECF subfamily)
VRLRSTNQESLSLTFEDLYEACYARLVGQVTLITTNRGEAEEAVQEAFARLWRSWDRLQTYDEPEGWVRRVAVNFAISGWRKRVRLSPIHLHATEPVHETDIAAAVSVLNALKQLDIRQRQALVLHYFEGRSVDEIATAMSTKDGTVKSWLSRGRQVLYALLDEGIAQ